MTVMQAPPKIQRLGSRPIIAPESVDGYAAVFNAGLVYHDSRFHLFARGVRAGYRRNPLPGPRFVDYRSDVLSFASHDGLTYTFESVLAQGAETGVWSYEDPRVQWVGDETGSYYMTYTDLPPPDSPDPWRVGIHRLLYRDGSFELNRTSGRVVGPPGVPDKDAVIFELEDGRPAMLHRIHPDIQLAVFDSMDALFEPPDGYWDEHLEHLHDHVIIRPSPGALGVGAGAPPIRGSEGLLFFFHERSAAGTYTARLALLDPASGRVEAMLPDPVLVPELDWERFGDVDDVVFVQGAQKLEDGRIYVTYGAADRAVGAGTIDECSILDALLPQQ